MLWSSCPECPDQSSHGLCSAVVSGKRVIVFYYLQQDNLFATENVQDFTSLFSPSPTPIMLVNCMLSSPVADMMLLWSTGQRQVRDGRDHFCAKSKI
jgi:hypothetical protein